MVFSAIFAYTWPFPRTSTYLNSNCNGERKKIKQNFQSNAIYSILQWVYKTNENDWPIFEILKIIGILLVWQLPISPFGSSKINEWQKHFGNICVCASADAAAAAATTKESWNVCAPLIERVQLNRCSNVVYTIKTHTYDFQLDTYCILHNENWINSFVLSFIKKWNWNAFQMLKNWWWYVFIWPNVKCQILFNF